MTTQDNEHNGRSEFPNGIKSKPQRRARARECEPHLPLASLGDALAAAGLSGEPVSERARAAGDVDAMPVAAALTWSVRRRKACSSRPRTLCAPNATPAISSRR